MPVTKPRICQAPNCENDLSGKRQDALYCSTSCKLDVYHDRRGTQTKRRRDHIKCQRKGCRNTIPESLRADSKYCSNACRQKVWHDRNKDRTKAKRDAVRAVETEKKEKKKEKKAVEEFIQELMGE